MIKIQVDDWIFDEIGVKLNIVVNSNIKIIYVPIETTHGKFSIMFIRRNNIENLMTIKEAISKILNKTGCPINQAGDIALALEALGLIKFKETENNSVDTDKVVDQAERYLKGFKLDNESYYLMVQNLMRIIRKHFKTGYRFEHPPKTEILDSPRPVSRDHLKRDFQIAINELKTVLNRFENCIREI